MKTGCLLPWANHGVLLLNAVLTVEAHKAGSHRKLHWEQFTDQVIQATNSRPQPIAFVLWGNFAIKKAPLIQTNALAIGADLSASAVPCPPIAASLAAVRFLKSTSFLWKTVRSPWTGPWNNDKNPGSLQNA